MTLIRFISLVLGISIFATFGFADELALHFVNGHHKKNAPPSAAPSPTPAPSLQTYMVRIPASATSCDENAKQLAQKFEAVTNVTVTSAKCNARVSLHADDTTYPIDSITLSYMSAAKAKSYSAIFGYASYDDQVPSGYSGAYSKYSDCLADSDQQVKNFEQETGLKPVAIWCGPASFGIPMLYALHIDSFGTPQKTLFVYTPTYRDVAEADLLTWVKQLISNQPINIIKETDRGIFYYGKKRIPVGHGLLTSFSYLKTCQDQLGEAETMMKNVGLKAIVQCLSTTGDLDMGGSTILEGVWSGDDHFTHETPLDISGYYSLKECYADKARVIAEQRKSGRFVLGAFCREGDDLNQSFTIDVVEEL